MKDNKQRLFEVMGRLDKTFKPKLNEGFEEIEATDNMEIPAEIGAGDEIPIEEPVEEKSIEEKYDELKGKVEELYAMIQGEEKGEEEIPVDNVEEPVDGEISVDNVEEPVEIENLEESNKEEKDKEKVPVEAVANVSK